jgi:type IX secretion system PorP/SprF family membrane protein
MLLNVEQLMKDWRSGIGLTVYNVSQHVQNNLLIKGSYNYHVQLDDQTFLAMGINMGFMSRGINDGVLAGEGTLINQRYGNLSDLGLGVKFYMPELQVGAAVQHIPGVILGEEKARKHPHFYYYMIYNHVIDYDWKLMPHVFLKNSAGFSTNVDIGFRVGFRDIVQVGAAWRRDAIGLLFGIDLAEQFHIGYSFDIHMGNKAMSTTGIRPSHEIVLRYRTEPFFGGGSYSYDW